MLTHAHWKATEMYFAIAAPTMLVTDAPVSLPFNYFQFESDIGIQTSIDRMNFILLPHIFHLQTDKSLSILIFFLFIF